MPDSLYLQCSSFHGNDCFSVTYLALGWGDDLLAGHFHFNLTILRFPDLVLTFIALATHCQLSPQHSKNTLCANATQSVKICTFLKNGISFSIILRITRDIKNRNPADPTKPKLTKVVTITNYMVRTLYIHSTSPPI